jgi:hypothetical protein
MRWRQVRRSVQRTNASVATSAKKRIVSGADVPGWSAPAYAGFLRPAAVVGVLMKQTLAEVKVVGPTQTPEAIAVKLQAVMKDVAARK